MRLPFSLFAVMIVTAPAAVLGAEDLTVTVARVFDAQGYVQVLARLTNTGNSLIDGARVDCDAYDKKQGALGTAAQYVNRIAAGKGAIAEVLIPNPPGPEPEDL